MSPSAAPPSAPCGTRTGTVMRCSCGTTTAEVLPRRSTPITRLVPRSSTLATRPSARPRRRKRSTRTSTRSPCIAGRTPEAGTYTSSSSGSSVTQKAKPAGLEWRRPATRSSRAGRVKRSPLVRTRAPRASSAASRSSPVRRLSALESRAARKRSSAATGLLRRSAAARSRASRAASSSLGAAAVIFGRVRVAGCEDSLGEHGGRDHGRPQPLPVPDGGLGDVARDDGLVAHRPDVLALVVAGVGVEVDAQDGGQHGGGQVLGVVAGLVVGLAVAVVLGEVAVLVAVLRDGDPDRGGHQTVRLVGGVLAHHDVEDLSGLEELLPLLQRDQLAVGRENRRHAHQVVLRDAGRAQRHLEARELLAVLADTLGQVDLLGNVRDAHRRRLVSPPNTIVPAPRTHSIRASSSPVKTRCGAGGRRGYRVGSRVLGHARLASRGVPPLAAGARGPAEVAAA